MQDEKYFTHNSNFFFCFHRHFLFPNDIGNLVEWWSNRVFQTHDEGEKPKWIDFCVVQSIFGGPTMPCDWIEVRGRTAHLKNESIGHLVGSECKFKVS